MKKLAIVLVLTLAAHWALARYLASHDPIESMLLGRPTGALALLVVLVLRLFLFVVAPAWAVVVVARFARDAIVRRRDRVS